jgi:hypothetical protein
VLAPATGADTVVLTQVTIAENNASVGAVDAVFTAADRTTFTLRYALKSGQPFVETEARGGVRNLRVEAPARFVILPDFFADDIVIDAAELRAAQAELPSDNMLLRLLPGGRHIVMTVTKTNEEDVRITLAGEGESRVIGASELTYGKDGKIWVAVLSGRAVWYMQAVAKTARGAAHGDRSAHGGDRQGDQAALPERAEKPCESRGSEALT